MITLEELIKYGHAILIILAVVGLGVFLVNQVISYQYKNQFIQGPCELCVKLNPDWATCYKDTRIKVNTTGMPGVVDFKLINLTLQ